MSDVKRMSLDGKASDYIMGIDLGTTNSAVSVFNTGLVPTLVPMNATGKTTMPSCVRWDGEDSFTVGDEAYAERYKSNVVYSVKRLIGSGEMIHLTRVKDDGTTEGMTTTPAVISGKILRALADKVAESFMPLTRCVITVPAYFNQRQIEDTIQASKWAELDCIQILKEPTSASYIYSNLGYAQDGSILIYDLGGGTFDITHMSFLKKSSIPSKMFTALKRMYKIDLSSTDGDDTSLYYCRVMGTYGDMWLGGDDIDAELAKIIAKGHKGKLQTEQMELLKLRCEQFKKSGLEAQDIAVGDEIFHVTSMDLEKATAVIFKRTMAVVGQIPPEELESIKTIVLVGGSTKSPYLLSMLEQQFPNKEISRVLDPDATVALGAGAVAKDLYDGKSTMYQDVLPMAIGVLDNETVVDVCIPKNTPLPHSASKVYHNMYDDQQALSIELYQGVSTNPQECTHLGRLRVTDLPSKPAGELNVTIYFMLSAQGRLTVSAVVDGVEMKHELTIDSIYNVATEEQATVSSELGSPIDDFEAALIDLCDGNEDLTVVLRERRKAIQSGEVSKVEELEARALEVL